MSLFGSGTTSRSSETSTMTATNNGCDSQQQQQQQQQRTSQRSTSFELYFDQQSEIVVRTRPRNLQQAFETYRNFKLEGHKLNEKNKYLRKGYRSNPDRMWKLRLRFVEQAKKYFGVPYAKKNFSPDSPEYNSQLFLDCCGLVRRCMRDLEEEFGFRIGPGNQAYMFDTLPKIIDDIAMVKPGDLVFISAIYYNPKMKKQPHNITHVEIMLGEGEKTIGARWNNGTVQFFDSYKFDSKNYHSPKYYIKSLDPWLLGFCRSYCLNHGWNYDTAIHNKRSVFYTPSSRKSSKSRSPHRHVKTLKKATITTETVINGNNKKRRRRRRRSHRRKSQTITTTRRRSPLKRPMCQESLTQMAKTQEVVDDGNSEFSQEDDDDDEGEDYIVVGEEEDVNAEEEENQEDTIDGRFRTCLHIHEANIEN